MERTNNNTILITAGGGGHFAPALAVIKALQQARETEVLFVGRKYALEGDAALSLEYRTVKELAIPFRTITAGRLQRSINFRSLVALLKIPVGIFQAYSLVRATKPTVIVSFGGYISLPVTLAGAFLNIPVIIHEQTMRAGLANRIAGRFARKICLSFSGSEAYFPKGKTVVTGNPLREELLNPGTPKHFLPGKEPLLFITGGSLGSHVINILIEKMLPDLLAKYRVIHQTGAAKEFKDYERLEKLKNTLPDDLKKRYYVTEFIKPAEIASIMQQASLVIGRAGMSTVTELIYFRKPAYLIPLPHGQKNEQTENASYLASLGLAVVKKQEELDAETMYTDIVTMMDELSSYTLNRDPSTLIHKDATEKIVTIILSYAQKFSSQTEKEA